MLPAPLSTRIFDEFDDLIADAGWTDFRGLGHDAVGTRQGATEHSLAGVEALAEQLHLPVEQVTRAYLRELARLESEARIKNFVSVIALGVVRTRLRDSETLGTEMTDKTSIVASLGERKLALPRMVNEALGANDRIKYLFTLLQAARHQVDDPMAIPPRLRNERLQAGIDDASLDDVPGEAHRVDADTFRLPALPKIMDTLRHDVAVMVRAIQAGEDELAPEHRSSIMQRASALLSGQLQSQGELIRGSSIDALTRARRDEGDNAHLLVMDMHKALNRLQHALAGEVLDGAAVYELEPGDRVVVPAFMNGLHRTAPLKFDHPGLGTTATRSQSRLVIQNDIGTTDAHVLVIHVEQLVCTLTYTDVHLERLLFFQSLFARHACTGRTRVRSAIKPWMTASTISRWGGTRRRTNATCSTTWPSSGRSPDCWHPAHGC